MSARSTAAIDPEAVRSIVAEVLRRIGGAGLQPAMTERGAGLQPAGTDEVRLSPADSEHASGRLQVCPTAEGVSLSGRVISLAMLEKLPADTIRVTVDATAVITPSAREYARDNGIFIERTTAGGSPSAGPRVPFVVAHAECGGNGAVRAAAIARAVPGAAQLPATGLADIVVTLALQASRDGACGILLTGKPAVACVLANRSASLRAVTARDPAALAAAAAECSANLLVVDPATFPAAALSRVASELAARPATEVPASLAARRSDCGCKGH